MARIPETAANPGEQVIARIFEYAREHGEKFGKYFVQRELCAGKYSVVLLGFDPELRRQVILKRYCDKLTDDHRELVLNEGQTLSQIDSDYVAKCLAVEEIEGHLCLVLEYLPGATLNNLPTPLAMDEVEAILGDIVKGVKAVHERGLLHLDLKPSNIILTTKGTTRAVLIDFGLAQPISNVQFGKVSGTLSYMAPEVARHELSSIDVRADIFGIGAVLNFLLTGAAPNCTAEKTDTNSPEYKSNRLFDLRDRCVAANPSARFQSIQDLEREVCIRSSSLSPKKMALAAMLTLMVLPGLLAFTNWSPFGLGSSAVNSEILSTSSRLDDSAEMASPLHDFQSIASVLKPVIDDGRIPKKLPDAFDVKHYFQVASNGLIELEADDPNCELKLEPSRSCWLQSLSLQYEGNSLMPFQLDFSEVKADERRSIELVPAAASEEKVEYFVVIGSMEKFDPDKNIELIEELIQERGPVRGIEEARVFGAGEKVLVLPYRVISPSKRYNSLRRSAELAILSDDLKSAFDFEKQAADMARGKNDAAFVRSVKRLAQLSWCCDKFNGALLRQYITNFNAPEAFKLVQIKQELLGKQWLRWPADKQREFVDAVKSELTGDIYSAKWNSLEAVKHFGDSKQIFDRILENENLFSVDVTRKKYETVLTVGGVAKAKLERLEQLLHKQVGIDAVETLSIKLLAAANHKFNGDFPDAVKSYDQYIESVSELSAFQKTHLLGHRRIKAQIQAEICSFPRSGERLKKAESIAKSLPLSSKVDFELIMVDCVRHFPLIRPSPDNEKVVDWLRRLEDINVGAMHGWDLPPVGEVAAFHTFLLEKVGQAHLGLPYIQHDERLSEEKARKRRMEHNAKHRNVAIQRFTDAIRICETSKTTNNPIYARMLASKAFQLLNSPQSAKRDLEVRKLANTAFQNFQTVSNGSSYFKPLTLQLLGNVHLELGESDKAEELLEKVLEYPNATWLHQEIHYDLARVSFFAHDYVRAVEQIGLFFDMQKAGTFKHDRTTLEITRKSSNIRKRLREMFRLTDENNPEQIKLVYRYAVMLKSIGFGVLQHRAMLSNGRKEDKVESTDYPLVLSDDMLQNFVKQMPDNTAVLDFYFCGVVGKIVPERFYGVFVITKAEGRLDIKFSRIENADEINLLALDMASRNLELPTGNRGVKVKKTVKQPVGWKTAAKEFERKVLHEIEAKIPDDCKRLVICGDSTLGRVSWPQLKLKNGTPLIERYSLVNYPNSREFFFHKNEEPANEPVSRTAFAIGDLDHGTTVGEQKVSFDGLPESRKEIEIFLNDAQADNLSVRMLTGLEVNKTELLKGLTSASRFLASCHCAILEGHRDEKGNLVNPLRTCALVLSNANSLGLEHEQTTLKPADVFGLDLRNLDLVILSGCSTAGGHRIPGDGVVSFQRAFIAAGARSVLACLWPINDKDANLFVKEYMQQLEKTKDKAKALAETQKILKQEHQLDERAWAGWRLMGDWQVKD